jgi:DNA-binding transcriptional ArsR family regulator
MNIHQQSSNVASTMNSCLSEKELEELSTQAGKAIEILKAMSHEGRLMILCTLLDGERTVTEIESAVGLAQATVSQHLSRLRLDRLLASRRDGRLIYYRIADPKVATLISTLHQLFCHAR